MSGQKKVSMKELASLYQSLNLNQVSTYIQSGNVVFSCNNLTEEALAKNIENAIEKHFGFIVPVLVLSQQTLVNALKVLPFKDISVAEQGSQVILSFLSNEVKTENIEALKSYLAVEEELVAGSNLVYLHCPKGYGKTKLSNTFLEKKLAVTATSRNLKTVVKLCEIAAEIA